MMKNIGNKSLVFLIFPINGNIPALHDGLQSKVGTIPGFKRDYSSNEHYKAPFMTNEELIKNHSGKVIEKLVTEVVSKDSVEVRFEFEDDDQWAVISTHNYEEDKEMSLRLHANNLYELCFGYYDDNDDFFEIVQPLTPEEKNIIPKALQKIMTKVLADERGMRIPGTILFK